MVEQTDIATASSERIEELRAAIRSDDPRECLRGVEAVWPLGKAGAPLVADLAALLTSQDHVPCTALEYEFSGHALLAQSAKSAIESVGIAPDMTTLRTLLADPRIFLMPEASYDQGAYIGDYSSEEIAPAGYAGQLVELMGLDGFVLLNDLAAAACHEHKLVAWPSQRAIMRLADRVAEAGVAERARLADLATAVEAMPEAAAPTTLRGFALRDLARHIRKRLSDKIPSGQ